MTSREDDAAKVARLEAENRRLRAQNRRLVEDLDYAESANRVYRRLVVKLAQENEARES